MTLDNKNIAVDEKSLLPSNKSSKSYGWIFSLFPFSLFKGQKNSVSVIRLEGVIGKLGAGRSGLTISSMNKLIEKAFSNEKTKLVCLCINSPGGSPVQSELIANRIRYLSESKNIPVITFIEDVAASGGYWLACSGDKIYASKSSIIGSIGVVSSGFGFSDAISKLGIERRIYTQGKNKSVLDPFLPAKEDDIKIITNLQKNIHEHFIDHVKTRRGRHITQNDDIIFNGEFWTGAIALDYGLVDGIKDMYSYVYEKFGDNVKFDYVEQKRSFIKRFMEARYKSKFSILGDLFQKDKFCENSSFLEETANSDSVIDEFTDKLATKLTDNFSSKLESKLFENKFNIR